MDRHAQIPGFNPPAPPPWAVAAVLALHLLLLWGWLAATRQTPAVAPRVRSALRLTSVTEAMIVAAPKGLTGTTRNTAPDRAAAARPPPRQVQARPATPAPHGDAPLEPASLAAPPGLATLAEPADADQPVAAAPAASSPLLDSPASRGAIRELARLRPVIEQAAEASATPRPAPGAKLGERIREAGKGDCAKGEFAGAGMGLLSLPFLVAAAVRDDCAQ